MNRKGGTLDFSGLIGSIMMGILIVFLVAAIYFHPQTHDDMCWDAGFDRAEFVGGDKYNCCKTDVVLDPVQNIYVENETCEAMIDG